MESRLDPPDLPYVVGCTLLLIGGLLLVERRHLRLHHLGLTARELRRWLVTWVVAWCAIQAVLLAIGALTGTPRVISSIGTSSGSLIFQLLGTGPNEEILWRCVAISQLWHYLRDRVSPVAATRLAVVIVPLGFALMHVPNLLANDHAPVAFANAIVVLVLLGVCDGLLYLRSRSVLFVAACHSLYNAPTPFDVTDDEELILQLAVVTAAFVYLAARVSRGSQRSPRSRPAAPGEPAP